MSRFVIGLLTVMLSAIIIITLIMAYSTWFALLWIPHFIFVKWSARWAAQEDL